MNYDYNSFSLMPKVDYSEKLEKIKKIISKEDLSDRQKHDLIKAIVNQPLSGEPLRLS